MKLRSWDKGCSKLNIRLKIIDDELLKLKRLFSWFGKAVKVLIHFRPKKKFIILEELIHNDQHLNISILWLTYKLEINKLAYTK